MISYQKPIFSLSAVACWLLASSTCYATAYSLYTESGITQLGNFAAGSAAEAVDATTAWYNPAGLVRLKHNQLIISGVGVAGSAPLQGSSVYTSPFPLDPAVTLRYEQPLNGADGAGDGFIPAIHFAAPLGQRAAFGVSIVGPYGLATHYPWSSPVRYQGAFSKFSTMDVSPELAGRVTDNFAIGGGIDFQYSRLLLTSMLGSPAIMQASGEPPTILDTNSKNSGNSFAIGFHGGFLFMFNDEHTRIGLDYVSQTTHIYSGYSQLTGRLAQTGANVFEPVLASPDAIYSTNNLYSAPFTFPNIVTLSGYQDINDKWAILGSAVYFNWATVQNITLNNVAIPVVGVPTGEVGHVTASLTGPQHYRNTWRGALGLNYTINEQWNLRAGGGYDETPTILATRDTRIPDTNRWAIAAGAHFQYSPALALDVGYSHFFPVNTSQINQSTVFPGGSVNTIVATTRPNADLYGAQLVWSFDTLKPLQDKLRSFIFKT